MTPISPGSLLAGRFRLEDLLEDAGGARFWRATDLTLARDVAVHVVDAEDPRAASLMVAARLSATVSDLHLLRVLDAAVEDGAAYVVNEWGNGVSLDRMLLEAPLPPRQAAWIVREVADALAQAHRVGVTHGRLVPENVLVTESGSVRLIGLVVDSVLHGSGEPPGSPAGDGRLGDGEAGQALGGTERGDVVNLGALLYAALVGRWPGFPASSLPAAPTENGKVLVPRKVRAGVPRLLDEVCGNVLDPGSGSYVPLEHAYEVKLAMSEFLGDVAVGVPLEQAGPGAAAFRPAGPEAAPAADLLASSSDPGRSSTDDPEATQAGVPLFVDDPVPPATLPPDPDPDPDPVSSTGAGPRPPFVGMGAGSLPEQWGPDAQTAGEDDDWDEPRSPWLRLAAVILTLAVLVFAVVVAFNLGRDDSPPPTARPGTRVTSTPRAATILPISALKDFDPYGGADGENPESVGLAHDGDLSTVWQTSTYRDGPDITVYKPGVGLLLDLGSDKRVSDVRLSLVGSPTTVSLQSAGAGSPAPTDLEGLDVVATARAAGTRVDLRPRTPVTTRYLVVWFTVLPPVPGGYQARVAEVVVRS